MEEIKNHIEKLYKKYENNDYALKRLNYYINEYIPTQILLEDKIQKERIIRKEQMNIKMDMFINRFMTIHPYYYCPRNELFIYYDNVHFNGYSEDDIQYQILSTITEEKELIPWKYKIKNQLLKIIKERNPLHAIPESETIQFVIQLLCPSIFPTKEITKYFLTILGDCIYGKNNEFIYIFSSSFKPLVMEIENLYYNMFGVYNLLYNIKFKYYNHTYSKCRVLYIKKEKVKIDYLISKYILDILCVSSHYSKRYSSSDKYIERCNNSNLINHVFFLKDNTEENIINTFIKQEINECNDNYMTISNMLFIWKKYLDKLNIPNIIFHENLIQSLKERLMFDNNKELFCNIASMELPIVSYFTIFFNNHIEILQDIHSYEYEIEEILLLFKAKNNKPIKNISFELVLEIITYFYPNVLIKDNKLLLNVYTKLWDKDKTVFEFYNKIKTSKNIFPNSLHEAYEMYLNSEQNDIYMNKDCFYTISKKIYKNIDHNNFFL